MGIRRILAIGASATAMLAFTATAVNATTYIGHQDVGNGSADISITTDGHIGILAASDITSYIATIRDPIASFTFTPVNSSLTIGTPNYGSDPVLSATSNALFYNFSAANGNYTDSVYINHDGYIGLCLQSTDGACISPTMTGGEGFLTSDRLPYAVNGIQFIQKSGNQVIGSAASPTQILNNSFNNLSNGYITPGLGVSSQQLISSQESELLVANSTAQYIQQVGAPFSAQSENAPLSNVLNVLNDLQSLYTAIEALPSLGGVDPFLPLIVCPNSACTIPIISNSGYTVVDPSTVFDFNLPIVVNERDVSLFKVGDEYIVNSSILGGSQSFSIIEVSGINGNNVDLFVHNLSEIPAPVPEPATWAMMLIGFAGLGVAMRSCRRQVTAAA